MKQKCLVVEDALFIREIYKYTLRYEDYEIVDEATDGFQALEKIKLHQPDVVILDLVLPLKNGLDVLKEAHALSLHTRYIVVSSLDDQKTIDQAKALGVSDYLVKPFTKQQLLFALRKVSQKYDEVQSG